MGEFSKRRIATRAALLLLLAVFVVWWLLPAGEDRPAAPADRLDTAGHGGAPSLLEVDPTSQPHLQPQVRQGRRSGGDLQAKRGDVRVTVVGRTGVPLPGVFVVPVLAGGEALATAGRETDGRGEALLRDLPHDGTVELLFWANGVHFEHHGGTGGNLAPLRGGKARVAVTGTVLRFCCALGLPLELRVVDAETGVEVAGAEVEVDGAWPSSADARPGLQRRFLLISAGPPDRHVSFDAQPPAGWVASEPSSLPMRVSPYARELSAVYPLRRRVEVSIAVTEADGSLARPKAHRVEIGHYPRSRSLAWSAAPDAYGCLRIWGVPLLRDEILSIVVGRHDGTGRIRLQAVLPDRAGVPIDLRVTLPERKPNLIEDVVETDEDLPYEESLGQSEHAEPQPPRYENGVVVTVQRRNGQPAVRARVSLANQIATTDAKGVARFESVPPGQRGLFVRQIGVLPTWGEVVVPEEGRVDAELREGSGGTVKLSVVDDTGRALSFASFRLNTSSGLPWTDLQGGRQRLDRFTDHHGRRTLCHVEPGVHQLVVRWGARRAMERIRVRESGMTQHKVVLPRPPVPEPAVAPAALEVVEEVPIRSDR